MHLRYNDAQSGAGPEHVGSKSVTFTEVLDANNQPNDIIRSSIQIPDNRDPGSGWERKRAEYRSPGPVFDVRGGLFQLTSPLHRPYRYLILAEGWLTPSLTEGTEESIFANSKIVHSSLFAGRYTSWTYYIRYCTCCCWYNRTRTALRSITITIQRFNMQSACSWDKNYWILLCANSIVGSACISK